MRLKAEFTHRTFMVDFINILLAQIFYKQSSQWHKKTLMKECLFALLGSAGVKAARKMLMKLTLSFRMSFPHCIAISYYLP